MLVLTRRPGEVVVINEAIHLTVLAVRGSQVRIGIKAPDEIQINREEARGQGRHDPLSTDTPQSDTE
jgi:carbon storage regulator